MYTGNNEYNMSRNAVKTLPHTDYGAKSSGYFSSKNHVTAVKFRPLWPAGLLPALM